jgi:hypothetical protein
MERRGRRKSSHRSHRQSPQPTPFVVFLVVLLFHSLGVVRLSILGVVWFLIWFSYKPDHFPSS